MDDDKRKVDWAPTLKDAIALRDMYRNILRDVLEFKNWVVGFERDAAPVHGIHGYVIYARPLPEQRKPGDDAIEPSAVIPPQKSRNRRTQRHPNRPPFN